MSSEEAEQKRLGKVLALVNEKGGVGKTTSSVQLGHELSEGLGYRVCLIDNDAQQNLVQACFGLDAAQWPGILTGAGGVEPIALTENLYEGYEASPAQVFEDNDNLFLFGSSDRLLQLDQSNNELADAFVSRVEELREFFDFIIIDNGPKLDLQFLSAIRAAAFGGVIIPFEPSTGPVMGVVRVLERIERAEQAFSVSIPTVGALMTKYETRRQSVIESEELAQAHFADRIMPTVFHRSEHIKRATDNQEWVGFMFPSSRGAKELTAFANEVVRRVV